MWCNVSPCVLNEFAGPKLLEGRKHSLLSLTSATLGLKRANVEGIGVSDATTVGSKKRRNQEKSMSSNEKEVKKTRRSKERGARRTRRSDLLWTWLTYCPAERGAAERTALVLHSSVGYTGPL